MSLLTTLLCLVSLTACDGSTPAQTRIYYDVVFSLPESTRDFVNEAWVDDKNGYGVKLSVGGDHRGTDADARYMAEADASDACGIPPEVIERKVDERPIYIVRDGCNIYDDYTPPISTNIYFEKEGWVVVIILGDDYYDHEEEVAEVVSTLHWVPRLTPPPGFDN